MTEEPNRQPEQSGGQSVPRLYDLGAALVKQNGKTGLLRWDGEFLLEPKYDELTGLGCGVYLARRGEMWDLLSVTPFTTERGPSRELYSDQTSAVLTGQQLFLRGADGTVTALFLSAIPQLLESRRVPGWRTWARTTASCPSGCGSTARSTAPSPATCGRGP